MEFCACAFLRVRVLDTANRGVTSVFGKLTPLRCGQPALLPLLSYLLNVLRRLDAHVIVQGKEYDAA